MLNSKQILKREFNKHSGIPATKVEFTENETIEIWNGYELFIMEIGSDDDHFHFIGQTTGTEIKFPIPTDYPL